MNHPPHLPQKSCSITLHNLWHNVRNIIFFVLLSLFAGITGSLIATAWIEPTFYNTQGAFLVNRPVDNVYISSDFPDPQISQRIQYGTLRMYEQASGLGVSSFFPDHAFLGYAVMISSDGWAVAYMPDTNNIAQDIVAMDYQGISYTIETFIIDPYTDFVYIKFEGSDFRVMSFVDWNNIIPGVDIWSVHDDSMQRRFIGQYHRPDTSVYSALQPYHQYDIVPSMGSVGVVINVQGQFVGFVDTEDRLHSAWSVTYHMTSLLSENVLHNPVFSVNGYMVTRSGIENDEAPMYGFVVTNASIKSGFLAGDIIVQIDKKNIIPETLYQNMYMLDEETIFHVLRGSHEIDILITSNN